MALRQGPSHIQGLLEVRAGSLRVCRAGEPRGAVLWKGRPTSRDMEGFQVDRLHRDRRGGQ